MAWTPIRPPPAASCNKPVTKPVRHPNSGPRRSASRTTMISGISGVTPAMLTSGVKVACATEPPATVRINRVRISHPS